LEAVNFFVSAFEFGFLQAMVGVRQMLNLVWSREATVREAVVAAYKKLYIDCGKKDQGTRAQSIVSNFVALVNGATIGELASLEELIFMLVTSGDIDCDCFQVLWQQFTKTGPSANLTDEDSRSALVLLGMIASSEPAVITSNMSLLIRTALTERGAKDFQLVHDACVALAKVASLKKKPDELPVKLDAHHELFVSLKKIVVDGIANDNSDFYVPMCQKALTVVYHFAEQPDIMCGGWIKDICKIILVNEEDGEGSEESMSLDELMIRRLVGLVGHLAVCQLNHLDVAVLGELKRRKALRDKRKEEKHAVSKLKGATRGGNKRKSSLAGGKK